MTGVSNEESGSEGGGREAFQCRHVSKESRRCVQISGFSGEQGGAASEGTESCTVKAMGGQVQVFAGGNDSPDRVQALKLGMSRP